MTYTESMYTVIETPTFLEDARRIWSEQERGAFCAWLAAYTKSVRGNIPAHILKAVREAIENE